MGGRRVAVLVGLVVLAASEEYVIWRSSALNGFEWQPSSRAYTSKTECEEAIQARKQRVARALSFLRTIGADDTVQRALGDRIYECRPTLTGPPAREPTGGEPQSP